MGDVLRAASLVLLLGLGCSPTVGVEAPKEPIVINLNVKIEQFPSNLVASRFGFIQAEFFELDDAEAEAASRPVRVDFGTGPR